MPQIALFGKIGLGQIAHTLPTPFMSGNEMVVFGSFLRLHVADGDASPETLRSYHSSAAQFVAWCAERGLDPATVTEHDIADYRKMLVERYEVGTVAVKLAAIRRLYEAAQWRGLRQTIPLQDWQKKTPLHKGVKGRGRRSVRKTRIPQQREDVSFTGSEKR